MSKTLKNFINGELVDSRGKDSIDLVDPVTGDVYAKSPVSNDADIDHAYTSAAAAFEEWRETTPGERQKALLNIADAMEERAEEFAKTEVQDTGKPLGLTISEEVTVGIDQIRFFAGAARNLEGRATAEYMRDHTSSIRREPIGVVGQVTPWNYPLMMAIWKFAPALAAGNTTVLKPSDTTPSSTLLLAEVAAEFLPKGVMNVVVGDRTTGALMTEHKIPQMVSITGSIRAGMEVAKSAALDVKRVHLELGGKAPVLVFDDADIARAVEGLAFSFTKTCTTSSSPQCARTSPKTSRRVSRRTKTSFTVPSTTSTSSTALWASSRTSPSTRTSKPVASVRATRASSSSRPLSRDSSRATG
jgi:betaine-aldehyde dehydrogenase